MKLEKSSVELALDSSARDSPPSELLASEFYLLDSRFCFYYRANLIYFRLRRVVERSV